MRSTHLTPRAARPPPTPKGAQHLFDELQNGWADVLDDQGDASRVWVDGVGLHVVFQYKCWVVQCGQGSQEVGVVQGVVFCGQFRVDGLKCGFVIGAVV